MPESFGTRLRRQREQQNIALVTIAEQTKIKASLLEALERDDVSQWPSGIFRRAYIRAYARAVGLGPDLVVREFLEVHPDSEPDLAEVAAIAAGDGAPVSGGPPTRLHYIVGSAFASLSRLRRGPATNPVVSEDVPSNAPDGSEAPAPGQGLPEPVRVAPQQAPVAEMGEALAEIYPVDEPTAPISELHEAADPPSEVTAVEPPQVKTIAGSPSNAPAAPDPDFLAFAALCTDLGRVEEADQLQPLLQKAAAILDARGLIVWLWDASAAELRPALAYGYSDQVVAQLPSVTYAADNVTAAAFRTGAACAIAGSEHANAALVVPLLRPAGCAGVLALELSHERERTNAVRAVATIFAALLAQLVGGAPGADVRQQGAMTPAADGITPVLRVNVRPDGHAPRRLRSSTDAIRATATIGRRASYSDNH
jgi:transcriptional regulator with XRE-family HTH domain